MKHCETCDYKKSMDSQEWCFKHDEEPDDCESWRPLPLPTYPQDTNDVDDI